MVYPVTGQTQPQRAPIEDDLVASTPEEGRDAFIPTDNTKDPNAPRFKLLRREDLDKDDFVVVQAAPEEEARGGPVFIPTDNSKPGEAGFRLLRKDDLEDEFVVVVAAEEGRKNGETFIPTNDNAPNAPGFKLLRPEDIERALDDLVVVVEASDEEEARALLKDIPRNFAGLDRFGPRLPLPIPDDDVELDDIVLIPSPGGDGEFRVLEEGDIPRDFSGLNSFGPRLPLPEKEDEQEVPIDVVIVEVGGEEEEGREVQADIPRNFAGLNSFGPKLPLPANDNREPKLLEDEADDLADLVVVIGLDDVEEEEEVDCFAERDPGTCLNTEQAWFYDANHNKCHFFLYSGCGGNTNR